MDHVLVTGGAGYIGSHACKALRQAGYMPVAFDNLSTGWSEAVRYGPFFNGNLLNSDDITQVFEQYSPIAVLHFAALSLVGDSIKKPGTYWRENINGSLNLIEAALAAQCRNIIFSSTCATYGEHDFITISEDTEQKPINSYGASKRAIEDILRNYSASHDLRYVIFRYFNVAGADSDAEIGERHIPESHLIPLVLQTALGLRSHISIYGTDYPTPDGTCIRDYVHVCDVVDAHILGLKWLIDGHESRAFNLGTGRGASVREVIKAAENITGLDIKVIECDRRQGDAAKLVSGSEEATRVLKWQAPRSSLDRMIEDAWKWHRSPKF